MNNFVLSLIVAVVGCSAGLLSFYQARQANNKADRIHEQKVDAEAYERAQGIYDNVLNRIQAELDSERKRRQSLEKDVDKLWDYTVQTRALLLSSGVTPPPLPMLNS